LKRKKLRQVKTNLKAYSDDGGSLTDNDVLRVFSGSSFLSEKRLLDARSRADPQIEPFWGRLYGITVLGNY